MFETLDDSNFLLFAAKSYDNENCMDQLEFEEDLNRIKYIKRLFSKYRDGKELRERLILNHIIILYNVFEHRACTRMLCFRLYEYLNYLKPFLVYLISIFGYFTNFNVSDDLACRVRTGLGNLQIFASN